MPKMIPGSEEGMPNLMQCRCIVCTVSSNSHNIPIFPQCLHKQKFIIRGRSSHHLSQMQVQHLSTARKNKSFNGRLKNQARSHGYLACKIWPVCFWTVAKCSSFDNNWLHCCCFWIKNTTLQCNSLCRLNIVSSNHTYLQECTLSYGCRNGWQFQKAQVEGPV